ncbi:MAG: 4-phosphoerythronate dehydrogenase [Porphyromonadaceae bacterium]|nr:4-phosphoerythronate dehydrogenase [Porphyromonadaceae bacterium]
MIHVIAESSIPYLEGLVIEGLRLTRLENRDFTPQSISGADALIVRSITPCTEELLKGSSVRLICTATAGMDHIDLDFCARSGIMVRSAAGCNATAVAEWVYSALSTWSDSSGQALEDKTIGIIGVGHVGREVASRCTAFGLKPLLYDPPRAEREGSEGFCSLEQIWAEADIITLHTPLTREGAHPTFHLVDEGFVSRCQRKPILINACRGAVTDTAALIRGIRLGQLSALMIDCWEGEPNPSTELLHLAHTATPHIAGFSADGKLRGSHMSVEALCQHFGLPLTRGLYDTKALEQPKQPLRISSPKEVALRHAMHHVLDLAPLTERLKAQPTAFEALRRSYHYPRETSAYTYQPTGDAELDVALAVLGFTPHKA